jgi:predicted lipoprotein
MFKKISLLSLISVALFIGCSDDSTTSQTVWEQKSQMLTNWADNFIIPNYQNLSNKLSELETSVAAFNATPNTETLEATRVSWLEAYKSWQHVEMFNIGPAEQTYYHLKMNVYPASTENIDALIASGNFSNLDNAPYYSAQGFPAMDYLLFGVAEDDTSLVNRYTSNSNYTNYLTEIMDRMVSNTNYVKSEWSSYRAGFIASVENTATSSANKMTNDFIYYYEKGFRANKFGIPCSFIL